MIYIASDHAGFGLKQKLLKNPHLRDKLTDLGPSEFNSQDDYPDFVSLLVAKVLENPAGNRGILICNNGVGVSVMANKYKGIRAGLSWNVRHASGAKKDDNVNVLALPAGYVCKSKAVRIIGAFINTPFSNEERHCRRLSKYESLGS